MFWDQLECGPVCRVARRALGVGNAQGWPGDLDSGFGATLERTRPNTALEASQLFTESRVSYPMVLKS